MQTEQIHKTLAFQLKNARNGLLRLHKILLDQERDNYERERGKINSTGEFLNLVVNDKQFEWLRVMSGLIVDVDEAFAAKQPLDTIQIHDLARKINKLFVVDETEFSIKYLNVLKTSQTARIEESEIRKYLDAMNFGDFENYGDNN
ncbi:MAG: hypothetical protein H7Z37_15920 [Pyrinomonadaceae bacterium]|nr:hypothetical protein [Pyrinomonadaceae bacterium]